MNNPATEIPVAQHARLARELRSWHIFMIGFSGTIGSGLYLGTGDILHTAGPMGAILAFLLVGCLAVTVMLCISEMICLWPISNALVKFPETFVDKDLGIIVGIAYWYTYGISFSALIVAYIKLAEYFSPTGTDLNSLQKVLLYIFPPLFLLVLNMLGVFYYGMTELIGGILKICVAIGIIFLQISINLRHPPGGRAPIYEEYFSGTVFDNGPIARCIAIASAAFAFVGVETVAVTAFEARNPKALRWPAIWIAPITWIVYVTSVFAVVVNIPWDDSSFSEVYRRDENSYGSQHYTKNSSSIFIQTTIEAEIPGLPVFLTIVLMVVMMSTANTDLYVASRTLFGLTRGIKPTDRWFHWRRLALLGRTNDSKVPSAAIVVTWLIFVGIPFVHLDNHKAIRDLSLTSVLANIGTTGCVLVWAAQCLAYIRFHKCQKEHQDALAQINPEYDRRPLRDDQTRSRYPFKPDFQPLLAYLGLIGCLVLVFILNTATWWTAGGNFKLIVTAYGGPILLILAFILLKMKRYVDGDLKWRFWEPLSPQDVTGVCTKFTELTNQIHPVVGVPWNENRTPGRTRGFRTWFKNMNKKRPNEHVENNSDSHGSNADLPILLTEMPPVHHRSDTNYRRRQSIHLI